MFDLDDPEQGISHVVAPELGMVLPGATHAVPDSHASTVGGLGALAFGCGTTELAHILATQVIAMKRPKSMRIRLDGTLGPHVTAKDVALRIIAELGMAGARGHVVEYAGAAVARHADRAAHDAVQSQHRDGRPLGLRGARRRDLPVDRRPAVCAAGRAVGSRAGALAHAHERRRRRRSTASIVLDCNGLEPQITWGTDPSQVLGISGRVPDPASAPSRRGAPRWKARSPIWACKPGMPLAGLPVNRVFIGSCTNARLPDLEAAADVVRGRKVAQGVVAMVVPGSSTVKREAEAKGLDRVFRDAGFFWGESGCSMCAGGNGDRGEPGERIVSTTNRNFENRQGPKMRTHLASPATAAASAIAGRIADVRQVMAGERLMQPFTSHTGIAVPLHQGRHQHRPDRAGAGDPRAQAGLQEAAVHARARDDGSETRTSCSTSRSSAIPASW